MNDLDAAMDSVLSGFFWLVLGIAVVVVGFGFVKTQAGKVLPKTAGGAIQNLDVAVADRLFMLGQNRLAHRIGEEKEAKTTLGVRLGVPALIGVVGYVYYADVAGSGLNAQLSFAVEYGVYCVMVYMVSYLWAFTLHYDENSLRVRNRLFMIKQYDLRELDSVTVTQKGGYKLWFDDGQKAVVPKHITDSAGFYRDMRDVVARNMP